MGFLIVIAVGIVIGWIAAIVIYRDDRTGTALCAATGLTGSLIGAGLVGDVSLAHGVSATQLLWSALGAAGMVLLTNRLFAPRLYRASTGSV